MRAPAASTLCYRALPPLLFLPTLDLSLHLSRLPPLLALLTVAPSAVPWRRGAAAAGGAGARRVRPRAGRGGGTICACDASSGSLTIITLSDVYDVSDPVV